MTTLRPQAPSIALLEPRIFLATTAQLVASIPGEMSRVATVGNYAYVSHLNDSSVDIIDLSSPAAPKRIGSFSAGGSNADIDVNGKYAFLTVWDVGLEVFDCSNPAAPRQVATFEKDWNALAGCWAGNRFYVADSQYGLWILDIGEPLQPKVLGLSSVKADYVAVRGQYAYVATSIALPSGGDVRVIDVRSPASPLQVGTITTGEFTNDLQVDGQYLYVTGARLRIYDITYPTGPQLAGSYNAMASALSVSGGYVHITGAYYDRSYRVLDVREPWAPVLVAQIPMSATALGIATWGSYAYVAAGEGGLAAIRLTLSRDEVSIRGTAGADRITGELYGGVARMVVNGEIWNYWASDLWHVSVTGGDGDDGISLSLAATCSVSINGGAGADTLSGGAGNDWLAGMAGRDYITDWKGGHDTIVGGADDDRIWSGDGADLVYAGLGNDSIYGGVGSDTLYGEQGNDSLGGESGEDLLAGGAGNDFCQAGEHADVVYGGPGHDMLWGEAGDDLVRGGIGDDTIVGGLGEDRMLGEAGDDRIYADDGAADTVAAGEGQDWLLADEDGDLVLDVFEFQL